MESRSNSRRTRKFTARVPLIAGFAIVFVFGAGCGARPDTTTRQFYERLAALDIGGMSELVCKAERPAFRQSVGFLESVSAARTLGLEDFRIRTESSDGTSATMKVSGRFVDEELGEVVLSARQRLVREGGVWCISGQQDDFQAVQASAGDVFSLAVRGRTSRGTGFNFPEDRRTIPVVVVTPPPSGPPEVGGEIVTANSGLRYVEIEVGAGALPEPGQTLAVHYTLWLEASGEQIDTSLDGKPFEFALGQSMVIAGWEEGLATMREGGKRRLIVSPELAYGDAGQGAIPPNSTLVFDVELVDVR